MNVWVFSDLHVEHAAFDLIEPAPRPDLLVVAGDVSTPLSSAVSWLRNSTSIPVVFVAGNHEFYDADIQVERQLGKQLAREAGIRLLEEDVVIVDGVRIVGCTLWTDYRLHGDPVFAMRHASVALTDHRLIRLEGTHFRPRDALALHRRSRTWLEGVLGEAFDGPTVVVTHHAPHAASISPAFPGDALNPAFASDLTDLIEQYRPELWIHGHVHSCSDYRIGRTRVICNPRGYGTENAEFDPGLIVEVN